MPASRNASCIGKARTLAADLVQTRQIPGFTVAVARNGTVLWSEAFGLANVEQNLPASPLTRFRVGSVSKLLTVAALAKLVEAGKLDLDAPVQRYVPAFPENKWPFTARQLAGHLAGIRHYAVKDFSALSSGPHFTTIADGLKIFADDPLQSEPGTAYTYSSYGYNLLGAVVEGASGKEFLAFVQSEVLDPLGLTHIAADHPFQIIPNRSSFYSRTNAGTLLNAAYVDSSYKWPSGGFLATSEDLVRFGSAHLGPGFLREDTLKLLLTSQKLASGKETGVGIGWRSRRLDDGRLVYHHGGALDGGRAMLALFPESGIAVAMLSNILTDFGELDAAKIGACFQK